MLHHAKGQPCNSGNSFPLSLRMALSSINTFSLIFQPYYLNSKYLKHGLYDRHKLQFSHHPISSIFIKKLSFSHIPHLPTSYNSKKITISLPISPQTKSHNFFLQEMAVLLVGSLALVQCICTRPVLALPPQKMSMGEQLGEGSKTQNEKGEEEEMYMKILEKNPRDVDTLKVLVYGFMRKGKTKKAVEYVERLVDVEPKEVEWRLLQAICYDLMGHLSKAKRLFVEILEEKPLLLRALHGLAMVMHKNHEGPAMFEMLQKALEVAYREKRVTEERSIKILIAQMHVVKGELEIGLKKLQDLVDENPRDFRPYLCQGIVYSLLEKKEEAEEQFKTYRSLVPDEFPQRGFLDDIVLAANTKSQEVLEKKWVKR